MSDDFIKKQLEESNKMNRYLKQNFNKNGKNENKNFNQDTEFKMEKISQFINRPLSPNQKNININDDISLTSLNSEGEDKF